MIYLAATVFPAPLSPLWKKEHKNVPISFEITLEWSHLRFILFNQD